MNSKTNSEHTILSICNVILKIITYYTSTTFNLEWKKMNEEWKATFLNDYCLVVSRKVALFCLILYGAPVMS